MTKTFTRRQLYDLVWSEPMTTLATRFGISNVWLKKTCTAAAIPVPPRGHWTRKAAGGRVRLTPLPLRPPGMSYHVEVGSVRCDSPLDESELLGPLPPPPEFEETLEEVRTRAAKAIGKVSAPRNVRRWHPVITRLLKADERREQRPRRYLFDWARDPPRFDTPFERRRLRILNALFFAAARSGGDGKIADKEARDVSIRIHDTSVDILLERPGYRPVDATVRAWRAAPAPAKDEGDKRLRLSFCDGPDEEEAEPAWQDDDDRKLESHLTEIAIEIVVEAERGCRDRAVRFHAWRVKRKAEAEEAQRLRWEAEEKAERERLARLEQARIDRLVRDAAAFRQANDIRAYAEAVASAVREGGTDLDLQTLASWLEWAHTQADRIDPVRNGPFARSMEDEPDA